MLETNLSAIFMQLFMDLARDAVFFTFLVVLPLTLFLRMMSFRRVR